MITILVTLVVLNGVSFQLIHRHNMAKAKLAPRKVRVEK